MLTGINTIFGKSFVLKQHEQSVICVHADDMNEEMIQMLQRSLKTIQGAFIYQESDSEPQVQMITNKTLDSLIAAFSDMDSVSTALKKIKGLACHNGLDNHCQPYLNLEWGSITLFEFIKNYYLTQGIEIHLYIFPIHNLEIVNLENSIQCWYMCEINNYFNMLDGAIDLVTSAKLPNQFGEFTLSIYRNKYSHEYHSVLILGDIESEDHIPVRIHSECLTGDCFHSLKCDCGEQLTEAFKDIEKKGKGIIIYLRQEGRGIGLINKIRAYRFQDNGADTVDANTLLGLPEDMRYYSFANAILRQLKVKSLRLMTNNPSKMNELDPQWFNQIIRESIEIEPNAFNYEYMLTKKLRMNHILMNRGKVSHEI